MRVKLNAEVMRDYYRKKYGIGMKLGAVRFTLAQAEQLHRSADEPARRILIGKTRKGPTGYEGFIFGGCDLESSRLLLTKRSKLRGGNQ